MGYGVYQLSFTYREHGIPNAQSINVASKGQVLYLMQPAQLIDTTIWGVTPSSGETRSYFYTPRFPQVKQKSRMIEQVNKYLNQADT